MRLVVDMLQFAPTWMLPVGLGGCAILAGLLVFRRGW